MTLKAGTNIDGWCTRCKLMLRHTIEAMAGEKITRVHCNTCGGQHAHRTKPPGTRVGAKRVSGSRGDGRTTREQGSREGQYGTLLRGRTGASARPYSTSGSGRFAVGELVSHATFGLGVVTGERDSIKIDILFADGPKVLLQGR